MSNVEDQKSEETPKLKEPPVDERPNDYEYAVSLLIIDDEELAIKTNRMLCEKLFANSDFRIREAKTLAQAYDYLYKETFHVILLDKDLGKDAAGNKIDGVTEIPNLKLIQPNAEILVLTGHEDIDSCIFAMQRGANHYLRKNGNKDYIEYRNEIIKQSLATAKIRVNEKRAEYLKNDGVVDYVCESRAMKRLDRELRAISETKNPSPILLLGLTGLGKTEAAKQLNRYRAQFLGQESRVFINVNTTTIPKELATNELFGHEKHTFTGSQTKTAKLGLFELAKNGDLFFDEIGDVDWEIQTKLLKVIDENQFMRMGGTHAIKSTARVIFATNKDLKDLVKKGLFREDLYYRISALHVEIPPLEERKADIPGLVKSLLARIRTKINPDIQFEDLPAELIEYFKRDEIPGNLRGIDNDLSRLALKALTDGKKVYREWRTYLKVGKTSGRAPRSGALTLEEFLNCDTDFIKDEPINLREIKSILEKKIIEEAYKKFQTNAERSRALMQHPSNMLRKLELITPRTTSNENEVEHEAVN